MVWREGSILTGWSIIPISDNGGSSSELIRVFGGPGIGDVRSMLTSTFCMFFLMSNRDFLSCLKSSGRVLFIHSFYFLSAVLYHVLILHIRSSGSSHSILSIARNDSYESFLQPVSHLFSWVQSLFGAELQEYVFGAKCPHTTQTLTAQILSPFQPRTLIFFQSFIGRSLSCTHRMAWPNRNPSPPLDTHPIL
jgi:hypothetical protein